MSKKKAFSGNTMTLKDFHGGSIPTDLPLPSAPGVIVRPADRSGYDRPHWGRSDHRSRPNSSPAARHLDDRAPFLTQTARIGRNFDEDERKPLDGVSAPRRMMSDDSVRGVSARVELKPELVPSGRTSGHQVSNSVSQVAGGQIYSYSGTVVEGSHDGVSTQNLGGGSGRSASGSYPNAWAARKEAAVNVTQPVQSSWSVQSAASKLAHASALDKVSSGRWQNKQSIHCQSDIEVIRDDEPEAQWEESNGNTFNKLGVLEGRKYNDAMLARRVDMGLNIEYGVHCGSKGFPDQESIWAPGRLDSREQKPLIPNEEIRPATADGKFGAPELHSHLRSEASERPKLKLLPRTKPLESIGPQEVDHKQVYNHQGDDRAKSGSDFFGDVIDTKEGLAGSEKGNQAVERPKLSLKPRSAHLDQLEGIFERERNGLFGGARPREVVLRARGIDDVIVTNHDMGQHVERTKNDSPKTERHPGSAFSSRPNDKIENLPPDQRMGRKYERRDHRVDAAERVDTQRRSWRHENRKNSREGEKQKQLQERQPSPETWRKPVEETKPASPDAGGVRFGKAASALELAQAFSKSVSDPKMTNRYSSQRGLPSQAQMPFSRLTSPMTRQQINGY